MALPEKEIGYFGLHSDLRRNETGSGDRGSQTIRREQNKMPRRLKSPPPAAK
jgi:hypothetical protein